MGSSRWGLVLTVGLGLAVMTGFADDPPRPPIEPRMPRVEAPRTTDEPRGTPSGTVVLTLKEYQDLLDRAARAAAPPKSEKNDIRPEPPSACRVSGEVAGDNVHLKIDYEFRTYHPRARVALGCARGYPSKADLDGRPPLLRWGAGSDPELYVQVEDIGDHKLLLEMILPLSASETTPGQRGFELDLPGAAVTTVEGLALPAGATSPRLRCRLHDAPADEPRGTVAVRPDAAGRIRTQGLGPVEVLDLTWEERAPATGAAALPTVESSRVSVIIDEKNVTMRAQMRLGARRGPIRQWRLLLPPQARVVLPEGDERKPQVTVDPIEPRGAVRSVTLARPSKEPLALDIEVQLPRGDGPIPVGPFAVADAVPQRGEVLVLPPTDVALTFERRATSLYEVSQRELSDEEKRATPDALAFRYGLRSAPGLAAAPPFLELTAQKMRAVVDASKLSHLLRLVRDESNGLAWQVTTSLDLTAHNAEVDHLLFRLPTDLEIDDRIGASPAGQVQGPEWTDRAQGLAQLTLTPRRRGKLLVSFVGRYPALKTGATEVSLALPQPVGMRNRGGSVVTVEVPDDLELIAPRPAPGEPGKPNRRSWTFENWPARFDLAWQPYRPDVAVDGRVLLTIAGRQASVRHELWYTTPAAGAGLLRFRAPEELTGFAASLGSERLTVEARKGSYGVNLTTPPDRDHPLTLEYAFRLAEGSGPFAVPLAVPEPATRGDTRVHVFTEPGVRPELVEGRWEQRQEEARGLPRYPALTVLARRPDLPLTLRLAEAPGEALAAWRVERALIQTSVAESGQQTYRARYLLNGVATASLDIEVPPVPTGNLRLRYRGKEAAWQPLDESARPPARRVVRVALEPGAAGGVLEVSYVLTPGRTAGSSALQSTLQPPALRNDPGQSPLRWRVTLPPSWVAVSFEGGIGSEYHWERQGWLLAPRPATSAAELEAWFGDPDSPRPDETDAALVCWMAPGEPLRLVHVPQQWWLLLCSLVLLAAGLPLLLLALPRVVVWAALVAGAAIVVLCGLFRPELLAAVLHGCQPGAAVLVPLIGLQWYLHHRQRRQMLFLPGFARARSGATAPRSGVGTAPRGEPSTVDAPPKAAAGSQPRPTAPEAPPRAGSSVSRRAT